MVSDSQLPRLRKLSLCNYCYTTPAYPYMAIGAAPRAQGSWGCVRTAYLSDYSTEIFISWPKNMPDVPNVHARQTRLPRCKCDQHRRRRRRWYPNATVAVGHVEPLEPSLLVPFSAPISQNALNCSILVRTCLQGILRNHDGDRPSPGQGSYQRWRERGVHMSRTDTSSSWTSTYDVTTPKQNVAHLDERR